MHTHTFIHTGQNGIASCDPYTVLTCSLSGAEISVPELDSSGDDVMYGCEDINDSDKGSYF
jgi:hypothetical protein